MATVLKTLSTLGWRKVLLTVIAMSLVTLIALLDGQEWGAQWVVMALTAAVAGNVGEHASKAFASLRGMKVAP